MARIVESSAAKKPAAARASRTSWVMARSFLLGIPAHRSATSLVSRYVPGMRSEMTNSRRKFSRRIRDSSGKPSAVLKRSIGEPVLPSPVLALRTGVAESFVSVGLPSDFTGTSAAESDLAGNSAAVSDLTGTSAGANLAGTSGAAASSTVSAAGFGCLNSCVAESERCVAPPTRLGCACQNCVGQRGRSSPMRDERRLPWDGIDRLRARSNGTQDLARHFMGRHGESGCGAMHSGAGHELGGDRAGVNVGYRDAVATQFVARDARGRADRCFCTRICT